MTPSMRGCGVLVLIATLPLLAIACDTSKDSAGPEWTIGPVNAMKPLELDPIESGEQGTTTLAIDAEQIGEPIVNVSVEPSPAIDGIEFGDCLGQMSCGVTFDFNEAAPPGVYSVPMTVEFENGESSELLIEMTFTASSLIDPTSTNESTTEETTSEITTSESSEGTTSTNEIDTTTGDTPSTTGDTPMTTDPETVTDSVSPAPPS